jgi:hypothetical protein
VSVNNVTTYRERRAETGDELDPLLIELFQAAEPQHAPEGAFCAEVMRRVRRLRRARRLRTTAGWLAGGCAGALLIYGGAADLAHLGSAASLAADAGVLWLGAWLISPTGWLCSVALGVAVVWRSRALRR